MPKKRRRAKVVPRLGPPQNMRPAGAHESKKRYNRKRHKAALARYDEDGFFIATRTLAPCRPLDDRVHSNPRRIEFLSRFPAELTVTLTDGRTFTECFNQLQMAQFMRESMLECVRKGQAITVFDGERVVIEPHQVASVHVVVQHLVSV